jgi:hypothetical protein
VSPRRVTAVAIALLAAALAAAGCGIGPGAGIGEVELRVTRDYGASPVVQPRVESASESDTVMRVLDRNAEISARFGGGFVSSIEGLAEGGRDGRRLDWFFYVDGVESPIGAADFSLRGGDAIWWDYRDWSSAEQVPAVVGSWPQPFETGYEGRRHPVAVECLGGSGACAEVRRRLARAGVAPARGTPEGAIRVLVGPWPRLREDPAAAQLEGGPEQSGVFAEFAAGRGGVRLRGLDSDGAPARLFGPGAGLVAATRRFDAPPTWIVSGAGPRGVRAAAGLLDAADLRDHYAVATDGGTVIPLPLR